jgi:DNA end-binding protein Ku
MQLASPTDMARAIWKGELAIGDEKLAVKMYSAVQDRTVHFRLLDKESLSPVKQRIVRKTDGKEVDKEDRRKAFALDPERAVMLTDKELEELEPETSRDIELLRFVPPSVLGEQWYDRPYYLGPDEDEKSYFALAEALAERKVLGISRWVMRKKRYLGALTELDGHLVMVTLRRAEQVLAAPELKTAPVNDKELKLAERLVEEISGDFDPTLWQDEYHERVCKLLEAKARGKKIEVAAPRRKRASGALAEQLRQSLSSVKERRVA